MIRGMHFLLRQSHSQTRPGPSCLGVNPLPRRVCLWRPFLQSVLFLIFPECCRAPSAEARASGERGLPLEFFQGPLGSSTASRANWALSDFSMKRYCTKSLGYTKWKGKTDLILKKRLGGKTAKCTSWTMFVELTMNNIYVPDFSLFL